MRALYANQPEHRDAIERRKRAFMAALALQGETQRSWAIKHGTDQSIVSAVLLGHRTGGDLLRLIYQEINHARRVASKLMADVA